MALLRSLQLLIVGSRTFCTVRAREILKPGSVIKINDGPHKVVKITHGKRGKGGGFVKAKLKNILSSLTFEKTFTSDELLEEVIVEKPKGAYSWFDDSTEELVFLGSDTFEEMRVLKEYVHNAGLLAPGEEYKVIKCEGKFIGVDFPNVSTCTVVSLSFETKG
jgi:elongation factor P